MSIKSVDTGSLAERFRTADPFPFVCIDNFLEPAFAIDVARSYPAYSRASQMGHEFRALNENMKTQVCDLGMFPEPTRRLAQLLAAPAWLETLSTVTGIPGLLWDEQLIGGGMHQTACSGHLDVHVDFNRIPERGLFRRLNLLIYLNERWDDPWGGHLELWDRAVKNRHHRFTPVHNRCVIFETSDISYHGVTPVTCPEDTARKSFAAYYYTHEAPPSYQGVDHSTIFRARPTETLKKYIRMPTQAVRREVDRRYRGLKQSVKRIIGRV